MLSGWARAVIFLVLSDTVFSGCPCDLTYRSCDPDCCCDSECSDQDKLLFDTCIDTTGPTTPADHFCIRKDLLYNTNSPLTSKLLYDTFFCVVRDNYDQRLTFPSTTFTAQDATTSSGGSPKWLDMSANSYPIQQIITRGFYKVRDGLLTINSAGNLVPMMMPSPLPFSTICNNGGLIKLLTNSSTRCIQAVKGSLTEWCSPSTFSWLDADYFSRLIVVKKPGQSDITATDRTINMVVFWRTSEQDQYSSSTPFPAIFPNTTQNTCNNIVTKARVEFIYNSSSLNLLTGARAYLTLSVVDHTSGVPQNLEVFFLRSSSKDTSRLSGNPGYLFGQPIIFGVSNGSTSIIRPLDFGGTTPRLFLGTPSGTCELSTQVHTKPVLFGICSRSGCTLRVPFTPSASDCQICNSYLDTALGYSNWPTHVAAYGNGTLPGFSSWVSIIQPDYKPVTSCCGSKALLVLDVMIRFFFTKEGSITSPQNRIIAVSVVLGNPVSSGQCPHGRCQVTQDALFYEIIQSVEFVDVSPMPVVKDRQLPLYNLKLPSDFFFPIV